MKVSYEAWQSLMEKFIYDSKLQNSNFLQQIFQKGLKACIIIQKKDP